MSSTTDTLLKILAIDDDPDNLELLRQYIQEIPGWQTEFRGFLDSAQGLQALQGYSADVVLIDYFLGEKTGVEVFTRMQEMGFHQPVILLTGNGDTQTAVDAMKAGIMDYIPKARLAPPVLQRAIGNAAEKYRLQQTINEQRQKAEAADREVLRRMRSEKELLEQTLIGSIEAMTQVLSLMNPEAFGRSARIKRYVTAMAKRMGFPIIWKLEIASLLSQLGWVALPPNVLHKVSQGKRLNPREARLYRQYPQIGADMIRKIPRMEEVAEIIAHQEDTLDGFGMADGEGDPESIPIGSRLLKVAIDLDALESAGRTKKKALEELKARTGRYDPSVLEALSAVSATALRYKHGEVSLNELAPPMILADDIRTKSGATLVPQGQLVTYAMLARLKNFIMFRTMREPLKVRIPLTTLREELELQAPKTEEPGSGPTQSP